MFTKDIHLNYIYIEEHVLTEPVSFNVLVALGFGFVLDVFAVA